MAPMFKLDVYIFFMCVLLSLGEARHILIFGGNGFLGADTAEVFLDHGDNVTIVNRGNWYWDSSVRILPRVKHIYCDRKLILQESCDPLLTYIKKVGHFDAVVDFSTYGAHEIKEAALALKGHVGLYILISTDSVYDVCTKENDEPSKETNAVRPASEEEIKRLEKFHPYGHNKLAAEEALIEQRLNGGFPFVMLRLPDVIGKRDSTNRFWIYQTWIKLAQSMPNYPVLIPHFLEDYSISFVYSPDVAKVIEALPRKGPQIRDQVINLAYLQTVTLAKLLEDMQTALGITDKAYVTQDSSASHHMYFYPSVRNGPISVAKALDLLDWSPTPWNDVIRETASFYEEAMTSETFLLQRNSLIQVLANYVYSDDKHNMYESLEKVYEIDLSHFKNAKDEL